STAVATPPAAEFGQAKSGVATDSVNSATRGAPVQAEQTKAPTQTADKNEKAGDEVRPQDAPANKELQARVVSGNSAPTAAAPRAPAAKPAAKPSEPEEKGDVAKLKKEAETDQPVTARKDDDRKQKVDEISVAQPPAKTQPGPVVGGLRALSRD